jgi:DNA ligase D-like protein (predicted polymerase)/DNA ligase D-like protein (predicted 3'-phosphoesterase)
LGKVLFPSLGVTKKQVIEYYAKMAPLMLDFLKDRALTMYRFPDGVDKEGFYEKDAPKGKPFWVQTFRRYSETAKRDVEYVVCNDETTLAWLANLATLEINISLSRIDAYEKPDLVLFDIDPEPPANIEDAVHVGLLLKEKLDLLGLESYVKTSGKKGLHVIIPVVPAYSFGQTRAFVHQMGKLLTKESGLVVSEFSQSRVPGTVFIDYTQNTHFKTIICTYGLRATEHATVSTPLDWVEVEKGVDPQTFNIFSVQKREVHPWKDMFLHRQTLDFEGISMKKESSLRTGAMLEEYTQKRDLTASGEPSGIVARDFLQNIFVVQEHRARRLHYDFRLARQGVLKSWAVPKGFPEEPGTRRLAVQTEDHPLEYSQFEGTIPKGQYGAGTVRIWDKGLYELKTWTDDKIEFSLKGKILHGKYALIKTERRTPKQQKRKEWLLIKLKE